MITVNTRKNDRYDMIIGADPNRSSLAFNMRRVNVLKEIRTLIKSHTPSLIRTKIHPRMNTTPMHEMDAEFPFL